MPKLEKWEPPFAKYPGGGKKTILGPLLPQEIRSGMEKRLFLILNL